MIENHRTALPKGIYARDAAASSTLSDGKTRRARDAGRGGSLQEKPLRTRPGVNWSVGRAAPVRPSRIYFPHFFVVQNPRILKGHRHDDPLHCHHHSTESRAR